MFELNDDNLKIGITLGETVEVEGATPQQALDAVREEQHGYASGNGWADAPPSRTPFRMFADFTGADPRFRDVGGEQEAIVLKPAGGLVRGHGQVATPSYEEQRAAQKAAGVAMRFNAGKLRYDLLPPDAIEELVRVYTMGAAKYEDRNWERGFDWMSCVASLKRHLAAFELGEDRDQESELLHMAHVAWNALAVATFQLRKVGKDDRVKLAA